MAATQRRECCGEARRARDDADADALADLHVREQIRAHHLSLRANHFHSSNPFFPRSINIDLILKTHGARQDKGENAFACRERSSKSDLSPAMSGGRWRAQ